MAGNVTAAAAATAVAPQSATVTAGVNTTRAGNTDKVSVRVSQSQTPAIVTIETTRPVDNNFCIKNLLPQSTIIGTGESSSAEDTTQSSTTIAAGTVETSQSTITTSCPTATTTAANKVSVRVSQSPTTSTVTRRTTIPAETTEKLSLNKVSLALSDKRSVCDSVIQELPSTKVSSAQFGLPTIQQKRKFSFPAALHANLLGLSSNSSSTNSESAATTNASTRRRFSNVGDVVSRKLSNTIGWRTLPVPPQEVVAQGKALCCQYIRNRLKRSGIFNKKLGLYRLRSVVGTPSGTIVTEVYPALITAGQELERMHPKVFSSISRQASSSPGGIIASDKAAATLLIAIGREIIKTDVTWGKVVAVFAVAGGLAVDCVCQGHPEYLHGLVEGIADLLEEELAEWIAANGGWTSLAAQCRAPTPEITTSAYFSIFSIFIVIVFMFYIIFKFFCRLYPL